MLNIFHIFQFFKNMFVVSGHHQIELFKNQEVNNFTLVTRLA